MKTKNLIKKLLEADPSGEAHVCVGNIDITNVIGLLPAYFDGDFVEVIIEKSMYVKPRYNDACVSKVVIDGSTNKISLVTMTAEEAFLENPEAVFEHESCTLEQKLKWERKVKEWRRAGWEMYKELDEDA